MARPKKLNDQRPEVIERNFLKEEVEEDLGIATEKKPVVVAKEIPQMDTIVFQNNRDPGETLYFHYHSKNHPLKHYELVHGMQYTLPREVVRHLEGDNPYDPWSCHMRKYARRVREDGRTETYANAFVPNFQIKHVRA